MLEIISALKNNNLRKIPGYDPSQVEHLRKALRTVIRDPGEQIIKLVPVWKTLEVHRGHPLICVTLVATHQHVLLWLPPTNMCYSGGHPPACVTLVATHQHVLLWWPPTSMCQSGGHPPACVTLEATRQHVLLWWPPTSMCHSGSHPPACVTLEATHQHVLLWWPPTSMCYSGGHPPARVTLEATHQHVLLYLSFLSFSTSLKAAAGVKRYLYVGVISVLLRQIYTIISFSTIFFFIFRSAGKLSVKDLVARLVGCGYKR